MDLDRATVHEDPVHQRRPESPVWPGPVPRVGEFVDQRDITRVDGTRRLVSLRADDLEARFPGLLNQVLLAARARV